MHSLHRHTQVRRNVFTLYIALHTSLLHQHDMIGAKRRCGLFVEATTKRNRQNKGICYWKYTIHSYTSCSSLYEILSTFILQNQPSAPRDLDLTELLLFEFFCYVYKNNKILQFLHIDQNKGGQGVSIIITKYHCERKREIQK